MTEPPLPEEFYAHSGTTGRFDDWQTLSQHLAQTAGLAADRAASLGLQKFAALAGVLHDFGKYDPAFQRRIRGGTETVDHSTAGGSLLVSRAKGQDRIAAEILAYAILGHHAGLPDAQGNEASLSRRLDNHRNAIPADVVASTTVDLASLAPELRGHMRKDPKRAPFDLSVIGRMVFSCLVDADFRDTEAYYTRIGAISKDRDWPSLAALLPELRWRLDVKLAGFSPGGAVNALRSEVLTHIRAKADMPPGLFALTVPTGGGKTLASLAFALDHAASHWHRRIIYAIPFTSIIDQTAATFRDMFGDVVLEHHSAIEVEAQGHQGRDKVRLAMEDWAAPLVVTTNVQLFESLFAARPSRCRKLHNIAGSVIVLDEAQTLPRNLLLPTLRMIDVLATHYGCSILLCTATQPAFDSRQLRDGGLPLQDRELAPDPDKLATRLRRARILRGGVMDDAALVGALSDTAQGMVIVNSRKHALELFTAAKSKGLEGVVHLTTRQYPAHRRRILDDIRARLASGAPCRLIATSLIEAGVDLDFPKGWRAEAGLDSIVQSAGRVNREGKRTLEESTLTVFEAPDQPIPNSLKPLIAAMRSTASRHDDLLHPEAIRDWFNQVYWTRGPDRLGQPMVDKFVSTRYETNFPYRSTAEAYKMVESAMVPVIIALEEAAQSAVARLAIADVPSGLIARQLQPFTVQVPQKARELMRQNGKGVFVAPDQRGDQFFVLTTPEHYHADIGLRWEDAEYLGDGVW